MPLLGQVCACAVVESAVTTRMARIPVFIGCPLGRYRTASGGHRVSRTEHGGRCIAVGREKACGPIDARELDALEARLLLERHGGVDAELGADAVIAGAH